jgi:uncharacterized SAM-dependent methyltransferase
MSNIFNSNSNYQSVKPSSEFYSVFTEEEILDLIHGLEVGREIPLKYSYKGKGAQNWDKFYLKYIIPKWYRLSNPEIALLVDNFEYLNGSIQGCDKVNVIDVGSGNSYPIKKFVTKLNQLEKINKYIALDISKELLDLSKKNFQFWFPSIKFESYQIDIENNCLPQVLVHPQDETDINNNDIANIILHLGVTMGNHQNRGAVLKNFRNSMGKNDLLVFTNEIGSNSEWDGIARGGFKYHVEQVYAWSQNNLGIKREDCKLVRKYDKKTGNFIAAIKFCNSHSINFKLQTIDKCVEIYKDEEVTIWKQRKYSIPEILQEIEQAGLNVVHYNTDKYLTHIMVICQVSSN